MNETAGSIEGEHSTLTYKLIEFFNPPKKLLYFNTFFKYFLPSNKQRLKKYFWVFVPQEPFKF